MKEVEFQLSKRSVLKRDMPEHYGELSPRQYLAVAGLSKGWVKEDEFFCQFFDITSDVLARIDTFQLYVLTDGLDFLKQSEPMEGVIIDHIFAHTDRGTVRLEAPGDKLNGMTFFQFMTVDQLFNWYQYTEKKEFLYGMIASLYLGVGEQLEAVERSERIDAIRKVPGNSDEVLDALAMQWALVKLWLAKSYPFLFGGGSSHHVIDVNKKEKPQSWLAVFDALVGDDLTRIESYKNLAAMDVLRIVNRRIKEQQKRKK